MKLSSEQMRLPLELFGPVVVAVSMLVACASAQPAGEGPHPQELDAVANSCRCAPAVDIEDFLANDETYNGRCVAITGWLRTELDPTHLYLANDNGQHHYLTRIADTLTVYPSSSSDIPQTSFYSERHVVCGLYQRAQWHDGKHPRGQLKDARVVVPQGNENL